MRVDMRMVKVLVLVQLLAAAAIVLLWVNTLYPVANGWHFGSVVYWSDDYSYMNSDRAGVCDHTRNGYKAAVVYKDGSGSWLVADGDGAGGTCSTGVVVGDPKWHMTCRDRNQTWWYPGARCSNTSYH